MLIKDERINKVMELENWLDLAMENPEEVLTRLLTHMIEFGMIDLDKGAYIVTGIFDNKIGWEV